MIEFDIPVYRNPDAQTIRQLIKRPAIDTTTINEVIKDVFERIAQKGDLALRELTKKFDQVDIQSIAVSIAEIASAKASLDSSLADAIGTAHRNISLFHELQKSTAIKSTVTPGVTCWRESRAIDRVGLYIPGGTAPLFSTVLMLAIPAVIAGCDKIVLCSPPDRDGHIHPAILYAADYCGISEIYKCGGAQAIAAMTLGTATIPKVDKIFGPGNQYVTAAKRMAQDKGVAIDMPAGPSEVLVYAEEDAYPDFIAADLLSQAEHGVDSQVVLVLQNEKLISPITSAIAHQLQLLPRRDIAVKALENAFIVKCTDTPSAFHFINEYAPEHLIIASNRARDYVGWIKNAGSVFLGNLTPESAGDYASGTNHTLPTAGYAKNYSGVSLDSFVKKITFQEMTQQGLEQLGPTIITMAEAEQLQAHANAIKIRLNNLP